MSTSLDCKSRMQETASGMWKLLPTLHPHFPRLASQKKDSISERGRKIAGSVKDLKVRK